MSPLWEWQGPESGKIKCTQKVSPEMITLVLPMGMLLLVPVIACLFEKIPMPIARFFTNGQMPDCPFPKDEKPPEKLAISPQN